MGAGGVIHNKLPHTELEAWGRITGNSPTPFEWSCIKAMDTAYVNAKSAKDNKSGKQHQGLGDYCNGREVEKCRKTFGDQLERVCATCPS